jgi:hypothetical protein
MSHITITHSVGNMETWLAGAADRAALFKTFCTGHRIYRLPDQPKVALVLENVDMAKFQAALGQPGTAAAMQKHTVLQPVEIFVEIDGGR